MADRLTAVFYLLMRDHVPTGTVKAVVEQVVNDEELVLTAPELEELAARYSAPLRPEGAAVADGEPDDEAGPPLQRIERVPDIEAVEYFAETQQPFTSAMEEFLDLFDDRLRASTHFAAAVNEAADNEMPADEDTARVVAARVRELSEAAKAAEAKAEEG